MNLPFFIYIGTGTFTGFDQVSGLVPLCPEQVNSSALLIYGILLISYGLYALFQGVFDSHER